MKPTDDYISPHAVERNLPRAQRQEMLASWAEMAFGRDQPSFGYEWQRSPKKPKRQKLSRNRCR